MRLLEIIEKPDYKIPDSSDRLREVNTYAGYQGALRCLNGPAS